MLAALALASAAWLGARWLAAANADPRPSVLGLRLGMTADEARGRLDARRAGEWTSEPTGTDWTFVHRGAEDTTELTLHEGQLVAIRVDAPASDDLRTGPDRQVTPGSVLVRTEAGGRVRITLLSRACPTHHDEAERLVAGTGAEP